MTADSVERALTAAQAWLATQDAPEAVIATHEAGLAADADAARRWIRRLLDGQDPDGSWGGDLVATAATLLTIDELRTAAGVVERDPEIARALDWTRGRQNAPGAWTDGCTPERHERGLCHHFMAGFFSPAPPDVRCDEAWLRGGLHITGEADTRFIASTMALRTLIRWDAGGADVRLHLAGLRRIVEGWTEYVPVGLTTASLIAAVHALLVSTEEADRAMAAGGLRIVAGRQRGDGSWVDADAFQALEVFGAALDEGIGADRTRAALWHGARLLIASQQKDGSWAREHGPRRALIAWRTFRRIDAAGR